MLKENKTDKLVELKDKIIRNNTCMRLRDCATQLVFGEGNPDAKIVFVGEAPGKKEDIEGRPFIGASGRFLNEMLASIGLMRENVYITNIVKYRPPDNRDPRSDEKAEFIPYLQKQLDIIQPLLVVTLGRHSMEALMPELGIPISQVHGQTVRYGNRVYMPLFHPAAALYNGSLRSTLQNDFAKIPDVILSIVEGSKR